MRLCSTLAYTSALERRGTAVGSVEGAESVMEEAGAKGLSLGAGWTRTVKCSYSSSLVAGRRSGLASRVPLEGEEDQWF
jgi:hypothetical protein